MTLQTSGPISLLDVQNEFGGANPISISEYYGADTGVPTSGVISLYDFYGKSASWFTENVAGYEVDAESSPVDNSGGFWNTYFDSYIGPDVFPPAGTYSGTIYVDPESPNPNSSVDVGIRSTVSGTLAYAANNSSTTVLAVNFTLTMTGSGSSAGFDVLSRRKPWDTAPLAVGGANVAVNRIILDGVQIFYHSYYADLYSSAIPIEVLSLAGGGGGGSAGDEYAGGGGGAGGLIIQSSNLLPATGYSVVVGAGGASGNGSNSSFSGLTAAVGGGRGGNDTAKALPHNGSSGGSGGGGGNNSYNTNTTGGAGTSGQGNAGGACTGLSAGGGGGGGYSSAGSNNGGPGGTGYNLQTFRGGLSTLVAGGGGGGPGGAGQAGGGTSGSSGAANTGGGGGGADGSGGGSGGSGIVVIRYTGTVARATGGTITYVTIGSTNYVVHTFTSSGTFTTN